MIKWQCKSFDELSKDELYRLLALRQEVFVVEQYCPYLDVDGKDIDAHHLLVCDKDNNLLAYSRLLPKGASYNNATSIGRIMISPKFRNKGLGRPLMEHSIKHSQRLFGNIPIRIGAQCYLIGFYEKCGFKIASEMLLEDNIPHIEMIYEF